MSQTTAPAVAMDLGSEGQIGQCGADAKIESKIAAAVMLFGYLVCQDTAQDTVKAPGSSNDVTKGGVGIVCRTLSMPNNASGSPEDAIGHPVSVMRKGKIWVKVVDDVVQGGDAYCDIAGGNAGQIRGDAGTDLPEVTTIVFSANLVTSNVYNVSVNANAISPVTFITNNATTLTAIAAAIAGLAGVASAVSDGTHTITVTGNANTPLDFTGSLVTLGASQATTTITETQPADLDTEVQANAVQIPNARFRSTASAGGLALLEVNFP